MQRWRFAPVLTLLFLAACSSDLPNEVGSGLVDPELTDVLVPLSVRTVSAYAPLRIDEEAVPLSRQKVLYLGSEGGVRSRMLVNFDFADVFTDDYPAGMFTEANIKSVKLSLTKLRHYGARRRTVSAGGDTTFVPSGQPINMYYQVRRLAAPFDSTAYAGYPGVVPSFGGPTLNQNAEIAVDLNQPLLRLYEEDFLAWLNGGVPVGMIIMLDDVNSDPGLVGFAAREMLLYNELENIGVGTVVAPNIVIEFEDSSIRNFLLRPVADTSTFHVVPDVPADPANGFALRTCLRSYPALDFDFSALPADVLINRAVLRLTNDSSLAFGNTEAIVVAELDSTLFSPAALPLALDAFRTATYGITGQTGIDPKLARHLAFDVTTMVQRMVNQVPTGPRGVVLAAGEDFFGNYDLAAVDPDFYYTIFSFHGTAAADSLRPRIEISYSHVDGRLGGAR